MGYNLDEVYQSNSDFLKAEDIGANFWTVTINSVDMKAFDNGERKLMLSFDDLDKALLLNMTNARTVGDLYGTNTDGWVGRQVMLFTMPVDYQGKKVQAIRVRAPAGAQQMPPRSVAQSSHQRPLSGGYAQQSGGSAAYDERNPPPPASADDYAQV